MKRSFIIPLLDAIFLAFIVVYLALVIILPHVNPPEQDGDPPPGQLVVEVRWPDGWNTDVDLWVKAPGEHPVGYKNKNERVFNYLRDDLGNTMDLGELNSESAYTRGLPDGEYIATVHLYSNGQNKFPVPVNWSVWMRTEDGARIEIDSGFTELFSVTQERTLVVFQMKNGFPVFETIHNEERLIRRRF